MNLAAGTGLQQWISTAGWVIMTDGLLQFCKYLKMMLRSAPNLLLGAGFSVKPDLVGDIKPS